MTGADNILADRDIFLLVLEWYCQQLAEPRQGFMVPISTAQRIRDLGRSMGLSSPLVTADRLMRHGFIVEHGRQAVLGLRPEVKDQVVGRVAQYPGARERLEALWEAILRMDSEEAACG